MDSPVAKTVRGEMTRSTEGGSEPPVPPENPLLLADEQKMVDIEKPHHNDVLCGRGVTTNRHPGNESFRSLVGLNKELYVSSTKREKMGISRSIVKAVRSLDPPGRFLDKDTTTGLWHDIGHKKAVEKTSQALRDGAAMLRKQLSADLGDPNFLSAVFSNDCNNSTETSKDGNGKEKIPIKTSGKENNKESKVGSPEKVKVVKAKIAHGKKAHRREKSNPSALAIITSKSKVAKRYRTQSEPRTPGSDYRWNYHQCPPSPRSPCPPPHTRSLPNSPMPTWSSGPVPSPYQERHASYPHYHHSPYHHPPYPEHPGSGHYPRHSFEHYHGPSPTEHGHVPRHHSWSPRESSPHHSSYHHHYTHHHYQPHNSPPPPTQSPASVPPHEYYSGPPPGEEPREPWSPRRGYIPPYETYSSPPPHYSPRHGEYRPERSASWTPRTGSPHHREQYYHQEYGNGQESNGSLSVPSLGGEGGEGRLTKGRFSPKLQLAPRSLTGRPFIRSSGMPPRPPASYGQEDFRPPPSPAKYQRTREGAMYYRHSSVEEEKKTSDIGDKIVQPPVGVSSNPRVMKQGISTSQQHVEYESRSSPDQDEMERESETLAIARSAPNESRASPGEFHPIKEETVAMQLQGMNGEKNDDESEEAQAVDDIAMSPIPYDREDPATLLDLPDDILALPISPCGPNDDPTLS